MSAHPPSLLNTTIEEGLTCILIHSVEGRVRCEWVCVDDSSSTYSSVEEVLNHSHILYYRDASEQIPPQP